MRKQQLGVVLPLLIVFMVAAAAQTQNTGTVATTHAALQRLNVVRGEGAISVEFTARGPVTPKLSTLSSPARVVIDLPNTVALTDEHQIAVDSDGVKGVRVGMSGQTPASTRVVVDLDQACKFELVPGDDNRFAVKLYPGVAMVKSAAKPAVTAKAAPKASAPKLLTVAAVTPAVPAAAPVIADKKEVATKQPAATPATTTAVRTASASKPATDYVFVEPSYKPKDETKSEEKPAPVEPSARPPEAAAKFADKPASELLPVHANASMQPQAAQTTPSGIQPAVNLAAEQKTQMSQTPATSGPKYTGEPISVNLKDVDLKDFFRLIHEISGLNVVLDPNVHGTLTIVLDDMPWDQALDIVLKNNDLARELEASVLRIATVETLKKEADARRAQVESEALAVDKVSVTRFLSYAKAKDAIITVKKFLSQRGDVVADERTNAVIINDIPKSIPTIDRLLTQLDRKTQEVEIEARVVAATRQFARDIGTQLGFGWGEGHSAIGGSSAGGNSPTPVGGLTPGYITAPGTGAATGNTIPLFSNLASTSPSSGLTFLNASNTVRID